MKIYTSEEMKDVLPSWTYDNKNIQKEFKFTDFKEAFAFMVKVAFHAEILNHHPEWTNVYNKVSFRLSTHSHDDVTEKDVELAQIIDRLV